MNLLLYRESITNLEIPDFGEKFKEHIHAKKHPEGRKNSINAWNLLAEALAHLGYDQLPTVDFESRGKPFFVNSLLHFSISHSGNLGAVLVSNAPCAVDIERIRPEISDRMFSRCLSDAEKEKSIDFFEAWTKKECIVKLDGGGIPSHPSILNTLDAKYNGLFFTYEVRDSCSKSYALTALCSNGIKPEMQN